MWKESAADAEKCVSKDPKFIKGYYRLAAAQAELGQYEDAIQTVTVGLSKEPGKKYSHLSSAFAYMPIYLCCLIDIDNDLLAKQLKTIRAKRTGATSGGSVARTTGRKLTDAQKKEVSPGVI
jgi:hypothetical protein